MTAHLTQRPDINFKVDGVNIIQSVDSPCKGGHTIRVVVVAKLSHIAQFTEFITSLKRLVV